MGHHLVDFWINVCLCQSLIIEESTEEEGEVGEESKGKLPVYQVLQAEMQQLASRHRNRRNSWNAGTCIWQWPACCECRMPSLVCQEEG